MSRMGFVTVSANLEAGDSAAYETETKIRRVYGLDGLGMNPPYIRPVIFAEASYAPTIPNTLRPTSKALIAQPLPRASWEPSGVLGAMRRLAGLNEMAVEDAYTPIEIPTWYRALSLISTGLSAYHGYKRNDSIGWAIAWGFLGGLFPVITPAVAFAQGFGKRAR